MPEDAKTSLELRFHQEMKHSVRYDYHGDDEHPAVRTAYISKKALLVKPWPGVVTITLEWKK